RARQRRVRVRQGRPGPPGAAARSRAGRARDPGERRQPRRRGTRLGHLRQRLGRGPGRRLRRTGRSARRLLRRADSAEAGGAARTRRQRGVRAGVRGAVPRHGAADPGRLRRRRGVPAMSGVSVAAVDLGATSGRVMVADVDRDRLVLTEVHRFPNQPVRAGGTLYWDVLGLYRETVTGLREAVRRRPDLASVGIDSWAVDYGLLDAAGVLLGNPVHHRDARTEGVASRVLAELGAAEVYQTTGIQTLPFNTLFQLRAAAGSPQFAVADRLLLIPDLLTYWLTGEAATEVTNASTTQLLDVHARVWAVDLIRRAGLPTRLFGPLRSPGDPAGELRPEVSAE